MGSSSDELFVTQQAGLPAEKGVIEFHGWNMAAARLLLRSLFRQIISKACKLYHHGSSFTVRPVCGRQSCSVWASSGQVYHCILPMRINCYNKNDEDCNRSHAKREENWNVLKGKGLTSVIPVYYIAWTSRMRSQLVRLAQYDKNIFRIRRISTLHVQSVGSWPAVSHTLLSLL